jgi:inhibitor of cysteine peptidase
MSATTAQNTAVVTARLRLQQGGLSSEQVVTWQFRRTMQNQWRLDDTVPACPFGPQTVTTLSAADGGSTVTLSTGDRLYVELEGNPTTGFTWELDSLPSILEQLGDATFVPESELIGGGGEFTLRFEAVATGSGVLRLTYLRPFEDVPAADTFEVTVVVQ